MEELSAKVTAPQGGVTLTHHYGGYYSVASVLREIANGLDLEHADRVTIEITPDPPRND